MNKASLRKQGFTLIRTRLHRNLVIVQAFTMIELLIVIAIIGSLAAVLLFLINPAEIMRKSRDADRISDMEVIKSAVDLTMADGKILPITVSSGIVLTSTDLGGGFDMSKYMPSMPTDPSYAASGNIQGITAISGGGCTTGAIAKNTMQYLLWSNGSVYIIRSKVESVSNCDVVTGDGNNNTTYELGTDPGLNAF